MQPIFTIDSLVSMKINKNYFIPLFILLIASNLFAQDQLDVTTQNWEPGKCYAFRLLLEQADSIPQAAERHFKVTAPTWETELDTIKNKGEKIFRVLTQDAYYTYILKQYDAHAVSAPKGSYMAICAIEIPAKYTTIQFNENESFKVVEVKRLINIPQIVELESVDFLDIPFDEGESYGALTQGKYLRYFKLKKGNWSQRREIFSTGCGRQTPLIKNIQQRLKDLGYDVDVNNRMETKTKAALTLFQKQNGLPVGQLDMRTIKMLEVEWD